MAAANDTPESDFSIECFQNYSAPEVFVQGLAGIVNQGDVEAIIRAQKIMLQRFEKTTEMLINCNALSANRLRMASIEFKKHTQLLVEMKKDLEYVFKKIRTIKSKLSTQYPEAYKAAVAVSLSEIKQLDEEEVNSSKLQQPITRMVATASTETLRPTTSNIEVKKRKKDKAKVEEKDDIKLEKPKRNSSSTETESASSGDESSTDTG